MISIESYRSSIGNFYPKAVCRPNRRKFKIFKHHAEKHFPFFPTDGMSPNLLCKYAFNVILGLAIISAPISLGMTVVFLKLLLLLLAGDVETNPGPVNNDTRLVLAMRESYFESVIQAERQAVCDTILAQARSIGLVHLIADQLTVSDGNCFYHAIVQQLNRPEIQREIPPHLQYSDTDYDRLRKDVVNFVRQNVNTIPQFQRYRDLGGSSLLESVEYNPDGNRSWDEMLNTQSCS